MPDFQLDDKQLKQLDGNIKQMISAGASQDDVMRYASDFKNQFGVKKKDQSGVTSGEVSAPIPSKLPSKGVLEQGLEFAQKGFTVPQAKPEKTAKQQKVSIAPPVFGFIPEVTPEDEQSTLADFTSSIIKGQLQGKVANVLSAGKRPSGQELGEIAQLQTDLQSFPQTRAEKLFQEKGLSGLFKENPKLGVEFVAQTIGSSLSSLFEASKRTVPAAVGAGAVAGAPFAGIGAIPGAATGLVAGQLTAGYNISTSQDILNSLSDNGVDISNKDSLIKAFSDEKKMAKIRETATRYGIPILIFDAATAGIAGKLGAGAIGKSLSKKLLAGAGEAGIQMAGGASGELAAQLASGKKVNWDDIALEAIAEVPGGVTEVGAGIISERAKTSSSNKILSKQIAAQGPKDGIQDAVVNLNRDLSNKVISPEQHQEGLQFIEKAAQAFEKLPSELNRENKGKSIELLVERDDLKNLNQSLVNQKKGLDEAYHAGIDEQVKANEEKIKNINSELYNITKLPQDEVISPRIPILKEEGVSVISPEENVAPEVVEVENVANVVMPEQNVPGEAIEISAKDAVVEKPKLADKLASFKEKYNLVSDVALKGMETKRVNQEAAKIVPMDKESAVLAWLAGKGNELNWKAINEAAGRTETARLNVGKDYSTEEVKLRDYASKERNKGLTLRDAAHKIWEDVSKRNPNITSDQVEEALLTAIRENPTKTDAARSLISISGAETAPMSIEEGERAYYERKGEEASQEEPFSLESGFVPFQEEEGLEEAPFAVQEKALEEVNDMKDIVKDLVEEGVLNLNTIKNRVAKELGYDSKRLRQTVDKAYQEYTKESTPKEVTSGVIGKVGTFLSDLFGGKAKDRVFVAKDGKSLMAKYAQIAETGGRVEFQATLPNGETVTAKPIDASVVNGFYSPLELQINQMKQDKMPAKQWLDKLRGEEAKWTGLSDWLSQQEGSLTKENIKNWLQGNQIEINEIVKGEPNIQDKSLWKFEPRGDGQWTFNFGKGGYFKIDASEGDNFARLYVQGPGVAQSNYENEIASFEYTDRGDVLDMALEKGYFDDYLESLSGMSSTKYSKYTLDGEKEDYKEILITYPTPPANLSFEKWNENRKSWGEEEGTLEEYKKAGILYRSNHFDEKNILVHVRSDIRIDSKGNKVYFIEEVQSDWGQEGKRKGFFEDISLKDIQRHQELLPIIQKLDKINDDVREASIYMNGGSRSQEALDISKFLSLSIDERKSKIEFIHNQKQAIEYNIINSLRKEIQDNNKKVGEKIDEELKLEKELYKYERFLETVKNTREYNQATEEWNKIFKEIRKLKSEQQNIEEFTLGLEKEVNKANERIGVDNFYYEKSLKTSESDFNEVEYIKIKNEYQKLDDKIIAVRLYKAPFVTKTNDWAKLGLKVALKNALEAGASKIAWTNGEQQNERYDLSKQVDYIDRVEQNSTEKEENYFSLFISMPTASVTLNVDADNGTIRKQAGTRPIGDFVNKPLSDVIGKEMAEKIMSGGVKKYEGDGLKLGGKGMVGFYGSPKDNSLGILGDLAKSLYKQAPEKLILDNYKEDKLKKLQAELDEHTANKTNDFRFRDFWITEGNKENADFYEKRAKQYAEYEESVLREIKRLGVEYQYSIDITPELKAQVEVGLPLFMSTPDGADILGFTFANKVYLNGEKLNPNTPIHEAGHIWTEWVKQNDPKVYEKGIELVKNSDYLKEVKSSKFYQDQAKKLGSKSEVELYFQHEALAMAIGDKGAQFVTESKKASFKDWLNELWGKIKSIVGFKDITPEELQNLTFDEFTKMAVKDILGEQFEGRSLQEAYDMLPNGKKLRQNKENTLIKNNFENIVNELIKKKKIQKIC
jgi:hypothetical protein